MLSHVRMHAGPYIRGQCENEREWARWYRREADDLEQRATRLRKMADEADAAAERWATGTDLES